MGDGRHGVRLLWNLLPTFRRVRGLAWNRKSRRDPVLSGSLRLYAGSDHGLTEVPVQAAVLRATANLLELLDGFLATADPAIQLSLGCYLIDRHGDEATDSITEAVIMLNDLSDAAELLHALAGDYHRGNGATPDQE
jgi:hypothetical protein